MNQEKDKEKNVLIWYIQFTEKLIVPSFITVFVEADS